MAAEVLAVRNLGKRFPPNVVALQDANLEVRAGEVHCLLGANGAGKSTLLKIIAGAHRQSEGEVLIEGRPARFRSPHEAALAGISMIYQELDLVPQLTVEQNLFLGRAPGRLGLVDKRRRRERAREVLRRVGAGFPPEARLETLSVASQQLTAIARSLTMDARVIIMDEPSASLEDRELQSVFAVIRELTRQGVAILYVSHRLHEIGEIGHRVTVLRGGRTVGTFPVAGTSEATLVEAVIGQNRSLIERVQRKRPTEQVALDVKALDGPAGLRVRDLQVRRGEIVGLSGLQGAGRTTFLKALFGDLPFDGEVLLDGQRLNPGHPRDAIRRGIGLVPEDRKTEGLVLDAAIYRNACLASLPRHGPLLHHGKLKALAVEVLRGLSTKHSGAERAVRQLSGGNQQKVVLAKWILAGSRVLLLDEPSRGLDVGAKADLYGLVRSMADQGAAVIVASSEVEELFANCDAIWVFHEGRNIGRFDPATVDQDQVLQASLLGGTA